MSEIAESIFLLLRDFSLSTAPIITPLLLCDCASETVTSAPITEFEINGFSALNFSVSLTMPIAPATAPVPLILPTTLTAFI